MSLSTCGVHALYIDKFKLVLSFSSSRQYDILLSEILLFKKFHSRSYFTLYSGGMVKPSRLEKTQSESYMQRTFS